MKNKIIAVWQKIYREWFDMEINISNHQVSECYEPDKHFLVLVVHGITMNTVVIAMRQRFNVCLYTENLDADVKKNDRDPKNGSYLVLFNKNIEADEELMNLSANNLAKKGHKGITLLERLLLEVLYYYETKKHLDVKNWTLCSGSRRSRFFVPDVDWHSYHDNLSVDSCSPKTCNDNLRSRSVIFCNSLYFQPLSL